ncbi:hypothetical protein [Bifidobacterium leontopitheci]|uniref:hypothetical protein n=1 Tax=Bifidobacterium leontopitheci TaxID=2650774 RepID=UPI0012641CFE|nr:hypothetical protein [Bifidobacterium leontopitheci]
MVVNAPSPQAQDTQTAKYEKVPIWRSPITQAALTWIGFLTGIPTIISFGKIVYDFGVIFLSKNFTGTVASNISQEMILLSITALIFASVISIRRITKQALLVPLSHGSFGLAVDGSGHRLSIVKVKANPCPICGGGMRYYARPTEWTSYQDQNGNIKRRVSKRTPVLGSARFLAHFGSRPSL